ncbi:GTPase Era [Candidatus Gottesmanbacteria bacterium RBG_13_37_7]|uniref:GTPase Era n=1 Tax=Candidatus Gottesmanbacteria bacterium RBG_13_37_7 TaxID=1798369 RepID=A0A1F5YIM1_9BACT|nr:MAG: GTPase Era [Candidatus Gottesmanbacteria bacterium RBG_13_37_7]
MVKSMKSGYAVLVGRPNSGKSTLLNNILKTKVSITSPKPQTTRFPIQAVYEDERGQIIFIDTPGMFAKSKDPLSRRINPQAQKEINKGVDVIIYLIDHTRDRDFEENKIFGLVRKLNCPKILTINKTDKKKPSYLPHYKFMEEEFDQVVYISALFHDNLNILVDYIFDYLPEREKIITEKLVTPVINLNSRQFIAEIIREKSYLLLRKELPYSLTTVVDSIMNRKNKTIYIQARIITSNKKYKSMIIGDGGRMIKEIGIAARKELETATNKKIFMNIKVESDPHWYQEYL